MSLDLSLARPTSRDLSDLETFWTMPLVERSAAFAELRARDGLVFFDEPEMAHVEPGSGYWALTRLDEIKEVSSRPDIFQSGRGSTLIQDMPEEFLGFFGSMINMDRPKHGRLRRIVARGFTAPKIEAMRHMVNGIAAEIVDGIAGRDRCDAVADIAAPLPLRSICEMMGIPASQHEYVFEHTNVIIANTDPEYVADPADMYPAMMDAGSKLAELMVELGKDRAASPRDDLVSTLVSAEIGGERLSPDELASFFILLAVAGSETTRNAISWGVKLLSDHPDQKRLWRNDIPGLTRTAVEEIIRWSSPAIYMRRSVTRPTEISGQRMETGDKVLMFYWSGNRDERFFDDPESFDIRRDPNPHLGFGAPGPHICLGMHLARLQISAIFHQLLTRLPDLHAGEPARLRSNFINGIKRLPCELGTPVRR